MASAGAGQERGQKRSAPWAAGEGLKKVKKTVGWFNTHGGLQQEIVYKSVKSTLESIKPSEALKILKGLEGKAGQIRNPTAWVKAPRARSSVPSTAVWTAPSPSRSCDRTLSSTPKQ